MKHTDFFEQELEIGDYVVSTTWNNGEFSCWKIIETTPRMLRIVNLMNKRRKKYGATAKAKPGELRYGKQMIKMDPELITFHLLKKGK